MKQFFEQLYSAVRSGRNLVLVSIISSTGSTPRGDGAKMAVFENGQTIGTIGGGAVEYASTQAALQGFSDRSSWVRSFSLTSGDIADLGMVCGGSVEVCFLYIDGSDVRFCDLFGKIVDNYNYNIDVWLLTKIQDGAVTDMGLYDSQLGMQYLKHEKELPSDYRKKFFKSRSVLVSGDITWFCEPLMRSGYTYIFGGGHVAQALVPVIAPLEFKTVIYEDRADFCKKELFPGIEKIIQGDFNQIVPKICLTPNDYVLIMTRGHQCDYEVLSQVLKYPAAYIGVIGSKNKIAKTKERLIADGFSPSDFDRIHWPVGLPIKARTPGEIAISIAAQLILCRAQLQEIKEGGEE